MSSDTNTKKKITFFLPSFAGGGAQRVFINIANKFAEKGFNVDLVVVNSEGPYKKNVLEKVKVISLGRDRVIAGLIPFIKYLKKTSPSVVFATLDHAILVALLAKILSRSGTKVIIRLANTLSLSIKGTWSFKRTWLRWVGVKWLYPKASKIVGNSKGVTNDIQSYLPHAQEKTTTIPNAVDFERIEKLSHEPVDHPWFADKTVPVILAVGKLHKQKDYPNLLDAFSRVLKERDARLIILGEGGEEEDIGRHIYQFGLEDHVDIPGFADNPYAYMSKADVYVLSSRWEGLPNTLIEALACKAPVVSTDCPSGPIEILERGKYGMLVPVGDDATLAEAIKETLANPPDTSDFAVRTQKKYSVEEITQQYLNLIENA